MGGGVRGGGGRMRRGRKCEEEGEEGGEGGRICNCPLTVPGYVLAAAVAYLEVVSVMNRLTYVFAKELKYCIRER